MIPIRKFSKVFDFWAIRVGDVYLILIEFDKNSQDINKENVTYKTDNLPVHMDQVYTWMAGKINIFKAVNIFDLRMNGQCW